MKSSQICNWRIFPDKTALQMEALNSVLNAAERAITVRGKFLLVLAGGTTPREIYQNLRQADADWANWHIFFGDERCLPADDAERNSKMAFDAWLAHVAIPSEQIHVIPAELGADAAATAYSAILASVGAFDLVLLGLGEDGHTASLFPGQSLEHQPLTAAIPVFQAPKPPSDRVSLSASRLSDAKQVIFLVTGEGKRQAVQQWRIDAVTIPAAAITPPDGVDIFVESCCV